LSTTRMIQRLRGLAPLSRSAREQAGARAAFR
jgi:hypothetical protein